MLVSKILYADYADFTDFADYHFPRKTIKIMFKSAKSVSFEKSEYLGFPTVQ